MTRISTLSTTLMIGAGLALAGCATTTSTDANADASAAGTSASTGTSTSTSTSADTSSTTSTSAGTSTSTAPSTPVEFARAAMNDAYGRPMGTVIFYDVGNDISVRAGLSGQPGVYAFHIHTTGKCDAPDFTTAGGHLNPAGKQHGTQNPAGSHMGDMPNITVAADGTATLEFRITNADPSAVMDADGAAVVMHEKADDNMSDPAGNAGTRIGCGIVSAV